MTKVLYVIDTLNVGGAEKSLLEMYPYFKNVHLTVCHIYQGDDLKEAYEKNHIKVISLGVASQYGFFEAYKRLKEVVKQQSPDVIHCALLRSSLVCRYVSKQLQIPLIGSFVNDSYAPERYLKLGLIAKFKLSFFKYIDRLTASWSTHYISITEAIKKTNAVHLNLPLHKITVIYRGREIKNFSAVDSASSSAQEFIFLNVARAIKRKGQCELIEAFATLQSKYADVRLWLAGDGRDLEAYTQLIEKKNLQAKVKLLGKRNDVPQLLAQSQCFVFPSHYEGLGGAVIEAMLAEKIVIASNIPVLAENVINGETGITFELFNVQDLADKMEWVYLNRTKAQHIATTAKAFALDRFDLSKIAVAYEQVYKKVVYENSTASNS